jgi:MoaE-MoaD fusion protein
MRVKILFFASLKERIGTASSELELPNDARVADLKTRTAEVFPSMAGVIQSALVSINQNFAFDEDSLTDGAEVAIFPPVSGGASGPVICRVTETELNLDELVAQVTLPTTGAACVFSGMVRSQTQRGDAHETSFLEYEAYVPMAEAKMRQVADEIRARWEAVEGIAIVQRIGKLLPGTPTVLIICTAAHRDTGVFDAARYGIDRLKEIVPVWKKEVGPDGETWIEGKYHPQKGD